MTYANRGRRRWAPSRDRRTFVVVRGQTALRAAVVQVAEHGHACRDGAPELPLIDVRAEPVSCIDSRIPKELIRVADEAHRAGRHVQSLEAESVARLQTGEPGFIGGIARGIEAGRIGVLGE